MTMASPLKWHGGKSYLASKFVDLMPKHLHYVEPFAGGLSVMLAKDPNGISEVVNDLNCHLINFWRVLQSPELFYGMRNRLRSTPFSRYEWDNCILMESEFPNVDQACLFFIACRQSLAGRMDYFATLSKSRVRRGMNEQVSAWLSAVDGLDAVHERLIRVVVERSDAIDLIKREDSEVTFFYLDPPYVHQTRAAKSVYMHEMADGDHERMLKLLSRISGKFMLSGYASDLYEQYASSNGWKRVDFDLPNQASGAKEKRRMTESIWINY